MKRVFISKDLDETNAFSVYCQAQGLQLFALPLVQFKALSFKAQRTHDVIFYSSSKSYEFGRQGFQSGMKIACMGVATAQSIKEPVDWIGPHPGHPQKNASAFAQWLGDRSVLFPVSTLSLRSAGEALSEAQKEFCVAYETSAFNQMVPECDVYVFTSPSNYLSFIEHHPFPYGAQIVAWGPSTQDSMMKNGKIPTTTLGDDPYLELCLWMQAH